MKSSVILGRTWVTTRIQQELGRENSLSDFVLDRSLNTRHWDIMELWLAGMKHVKHQRRGKNICLEQSKKKEQKINLIFVSWKIKCQQPFYAVLTSSGDSRYVMEENIILVSGTYPRRS